MSRLLLAAAVAAASIAAAAVGGGHGGPPARACSGGFGGSLEQLATAPIIIVADAAEVGDGVNRAPTTAPTNTPTATATRRPFVEPTPASPPHVPETPWVPPTASVPFDVTGFGATLRLVEAVAGTPGPDVVIDEGIRADVERGAREYDRGVISSCTPDQFAYRYEQGARYLVFAGEVEGLGLTTYVRYRVATDGGTERVTFTTAGGAPLRPDYMGLLASTHRRFFPGAPFEPWDSAASGAITSDIPLEALLRAVSALRGGGSPEIQPPDAGSAGLKPPRR